MREEEPGAGSFPMFSEFDPHAIEARWQRVWETERAWQVSNGPTGQDRAYVLLNECGRAIREGVSTSAATRALVTVSSLLQPFAPHVAAEVYYQLTGEKVWTAPWPAADPGALATDTVRVVG
jgi:leucyl-tRNA synthetase